MIQGFGLESPSNEFFDVCNGFKLEDDKKQYLLIVYTNPTEFLLQHLCFNIFVDVYFEKQYLSIVYSNGPLGEFGICFLRTGLQARLSKSVGLLLISLLPNSQRTSIFNHKEKDSGPIQISSPIITLP